MERKQTHDSWKRADTKNIPTAYQSFLSEMALAMRVFGSRYVPPTPPPCRYYQTPHQSPWKWVTWYSLPLSLAARQSCLLWLPITQTLWLPSELPHDAGKSRVWMRTHPWVQAEVASMLQHGWGKRCEKRSDKMDRPTICPISNSLFFLLLFLLLSLHLNWGWYSIQKIYLSKSSSTSLYFY